MRQIVRGMRSPAALPGPAAEVLSGFRNKIERTEGNSPAQKNRGGSNDGRQRRWCYVLVLDVSLKGLHPYLLLQRNQSVLLLRAQLALGVK
jgi:hypothetical protein